MNKILPQTWQIDFQHQAPQITSKLCMKNTQDAITSTLDQHAPEVTQKRTKRPTKSWYDTGSSKIKKTKKSGRKKLVKN